MSSSAGIVTSQEYAQLELVLHFRNLAQLSNPVAFELMLQLNACGKDGFSINSTFQRGVVATLLRRK